MSDAAEDAEILGRIRRICLGFVDADEATLQERPLFHVDRRRFAIFNGVTSPPRRRWDASGRSLHFVADPADLEALLQDGRFDRSPHHGDRGWLALRLDSSMVDWDEVAELLDSAHAQAARRRS